MTWIWIPAIKKKNQLTTVYNPVPWHLAHSSGLMGARNTSSVHTHMQANIYVFFVNILGLGSSVAELATQT